MSYFLISLTLSSGVLAVTFTPAFLATSQIRIRRMLRFAPRYALMNELILVMTRLNKGNIRFSHVDTKGYIIYHLERAAICLSYGIPKSADLPSLASRTVLQEKCSGAATAIRACQIAVVLPDPKTYEHIQTTVVQAIIAVAQDNLELLPRETPTTDERKGLSRIVPTGRVIVISVLPLAVLLGIRYAGLKLSSSFNNWAIIVAVLWAIVTLLSSLDPLYASRLKTMGDLISAIRGKDGSG